MRKMGERNIIFLLFHFISIFDLFDNFSTDKCFFNSVFFSDHSCNSNNKNNHVICSNNKKKQTYQVYNTFSISSLFLSLSQLHDKLILLD